MPVIGKCKLCLHEGVGLQDSHFFPAAAYKIIQSYDGSPPVVTKDGIAIQTNEQVRGHVFCATCEDLFNRNGEDWVMRYCNRHHDGFRFQELIKSATPITPTNEKLTVYSGRNIPEIDIPKLVYFASSVLWRGSCHTWRILNRDLITPKTMYEEEFRLYLLGERQFPRHVSILVYLIETEELQHLIVPPYGKMVELSWRHWFVFLGMHFMFFLGHMVPPNVRRFCTLNSYEHYLFASEGIGDVVVRDFGPSVVNSRRVGKLKRDYPG